MSEMVERLARAEAAHHYALRFKKSPDDPHVLMNVDAHWLTWAPMVHRILRGARQPTEAMMWAAAEKDMMLTTPKIVWQSMVDEALK